MNICTKFDYEHGYFTIGTYGGEGTLCVNFVRKGEIIAHRHDYGGLRPRALRIGRAIESIEAEIRKIDRRALLVGEIAKEVLNGIHTSTSQ